MNDSSRRPVTGFTAHAATVTSSVTTRHLFVIALISIGYRIGDVPIIPAVTTNPPEPPPGRRGTDPSAWTPAEGFPINPLGWTPAGGLPIALGHARSSADPRVGFLLHLGRALHNSGYSAPRLEEALLLASNRLGVEAQFLSTPTSIIASFGPQDDQRTFTIRVDPGSADLGKLAGVDEITRDVLTGRITPAEGIARLDILETFPPRYSTLVTTAAFAVASGSAARFLGGGIAEVAVGSITGLTTALLALVAGRIAGLGRVFELVAAFLASLLAAGAAIAGFPVSASIATLAGVIVLLPGLTLTTAITELSSQHLSSGTARLMGAIVLLLSIAFGIAFGTTSMQLFFGEIPQLTSRPLPEWTLLVGLVVTPLAFGILLKAEMRDFPWIVLAGTVAFIGARFGGMLFGPELGAFGGALLAGMVSYWYARITNRPSQITQVPGLLLLVPGSIGLRSFTSLVDRDVLLGVEGIFRMGLIAVSLAAGLLISRIVSPRRPLLE